MQILDYSTQKITPLGPSSRRLYALEASVAALIFLVPALILFVLSN